jgi:YedE family putative selenium metabolism protein
MKLPTPKLFDKIPGLNWSIIISGIAFGAIGVLLVTFGNPKHTGICVSCFLEGVAGSIGLHNNPRMMYIRPEIVGFILGAFIISYIGRDFRPSGGSSPVLRFLLGFFTIVGSAMFIGCPVKMLYRFSAGDLTALAAIAGLIAGVWIGIMFMREGSYLGDENPVGKLNGWIIPLCALLLLVFLIIKPSFITESTRGAGAVHAPLLISLAAGLILGGLTQRSRFCVVGSLRNFLLANDKSLLIGLILMVVAAIVTSIITGQFHLGMNDQPGSHLSHGWSFLGMFLTGFASVLLGGCPYRQLILSGEGNADAGVATMGMLAAGALVHSWALASSTAGPTFNGKIAVLGGIAFCFILSLISRE